MNNITLDLKHPKAKTFMDSFIFIYPNSFDNSVAYAMYYCPIKKEPCIQKTHNGALTHEYFTIDGYAQLTYLEDQNKYVIKVYALPEKEETLYQSIGESYLITFSVYPKVTEYDLAMQTLIDSKKLFNVSRSYLENDGFYRIKNNSVIAASYYFVINSYNYIHNQDDIVNAVMSKIPKEIIVK